MTNKVTYQNWTAELVGNELRVTNSNFPGDFRSYVIKQKNDGIDYDDMFPDTFKIHTKNFYYYFKFEDENFFVGDKYNNDNEHVDEFACYVFGED